ncbi:MAG: RluA family pseudouridine synthase [Pirellulales bacterium]
MQCFACQAVLTHEDIQSPEFRFGVSCPHCYRTPEAASLEEMAERQRKLAEVAAEQAGCTPYDNRRLLHVPRREAGRSLIDFLCVYHPPTPREQWLAWIEDGSLTSQDSKVDPLMTVRDGQQFSHVQIGVVEPPTAHDIEIVYQDASLIVINKPAPLPVHPCGRFNRNTLLSFLSEVYRPEKLRTAHRLDADTTGLVIFCRNFASAREVQPQFTHRQVDKLYLLRVSGEVTSAAFTCIAPISDHADRDGLRSIDEEGREAETRFRLLKRFSDGTSLLSAEPITGRTNQIRLHAAAMGLPIIGDKSYGDALCTGGKYERYPLCLHAWKLGFRHPATHEHRTFEATPPAWATEE